MRLTALVVGIALFAAPAQAQQTSVDTPTYRFLSGTGNLLYLGAGVFRPLLTDGSQGKIHTLRTADALLTSVILSEGLKLTTHELRPDHTTHDSFPSGHATAAFAIATMESRYHSNEAPLWYLGAALIADSRVRLHRHYFRDVLAGGILGFATAELELSLPHGLILAPFIHPENGTKGVSLQLHF